MKVLNFWQKFKIIFLVFGVFVVLVINALVSHANTPPLQPTFPGTTEDTNTHFEITDSEYFNITLDSSEEVKLRMESIPEMITMFFEKSSSINSSLTQITISGLAPLTIYYKFQDDYHNQAIFVADQNGSYTYYQDLSDIHFVFIQPRVSTRFIKDDATGGDCTLIGNWNQGTKTCTLTTDVNETMQIDDNSITLDGNGHTVMGTNTGNGIILSGTPGDRRSGITVKNLNVRNFSNGILLYLSNDNTFEQIKSSNNQRGIYVTVYSAGNTLRNNVIENNNNNGIEIYYVSNSNVVDSNIVRFTTLYTGIYIHQSSLNAVTNNTVEFNRIGISADGYYNVFTNNNILNNSFIGIYAGYADTDLHDQYYNNNIINNTIQAFAPGRPRVFNLPLPDGGNYWSDYDTPAEGCNDTNSDGFCDAPYVFQGGQDNLAWIMQDGWEGAPQRNSVVIVPGVLGSELNMVVGGDEVWPGDLLSLFDTHLNDLKLTLNGDEIIDIAYGDILRKVLVAFNVYEDLIKNLENQGYQEGVDLFVAPYDWRLGAENSVATLNIKIQEAISNSPTGKIDIIAHSLGTILAKEYILGLSNTGFIDKLIFIGSPNLGAPKSFKVLEYGDDFNIRLGSLSILNPNRMKEISQNMPSAYQLLPSREYLNKAEYNAYVVDHRARVGTLLDFDETKDLLKQNGRNELMLNNVDTFHIARDNVSLPLSPTTQFFDIVGCKSTQPTIGRIRIYDEGKFDIDIVDGDGTVPTISADSFSQAQKYYVQGITTEADHLGLVQKDGPLSLINNLLQTGSYSGDPGISTDDIICNISQKLHVISSHSPVELHVYDEFGNHTGPTSTGDIEFQIPNSDYHVLNNNNFVFVPADRRYKIVLDATSAGEADIEIETIENFVPEQKITYLNISLASDQTNIELPLTDFQSPTPFQVDDDGDGTFDSFIDPTAVLDETNSADTVPPLLTLPTITVPVIILSSATLTFSATDSKSGVAFLKATINGIDINSGDTVAFTQLGENIFQIEAKDFAGNPIVQEIVFNVVYDFDGFLSPLQKEPFVFQINSAIPIKFELKDNIGKNVKTANASLFFTMFTDGELGTFQPATSKGKSNTENQFRLVGKQYIFNWDTKGLESGLYRLQVDLDDTTQHFVDVELRGKGNKVGINFLLNQMATSLISLSEIIKRIIHVII